MKKFFSKVFSKFKNKKVALGTLVAVIVVGLSILAYYKFVLNAASVVTNNATSNTVVFIAGDGTEYIVQKVAVLKTPDKPVPNAVYIAQGNNIYYTDGARFLDKPILDDGRIVLHSGDYYYVANPTYITNVAPLSLPDWDLMGQLQKTEPYHSFNGSLYYGFPDQPKINNKPAAVRKWLNDYVPAATPTPVKVSTKLHVSPNFSNDRSGRIIHTDGRISIDIGSTTYQLDQARVARDILRDDTVAPLFEIIVSNFSTKKELAKVSGIYNAKVNDILDFEARWTGTKLASTEGTVRLNGSDSEQYVAKTTDGANTYKMVKAGTVFFSMTFRADDGSKSYTEVVQVSAN